MPSPTNLLALTGNLTADPELRTTSGGVSVAQFTVAHTPSYRDSSTGSWVDGETLFLRCSVWREYGERVASSLHKGDAVTVTGRLMGRRYTPEGGAERYVVEVEVHDVAASLRFREVRPVRLARDPVADAVAKAAAAPADGESAWDQLADVGTSPRGRRAA